MSIKEELQSLSPSTLVELFVLDLSPIAKKEDTFYFHSGTNEFHKNVVWQGKTYIALPIEAEGFEVNTQGKLPRPKLRVANVDGIFSALVRDYDDIIGAKLIRKRTFAKYLDAVNFEGGNEFADPNQFIPDDAWYIDRKSSENRYMIEWELASAYDLQGVKLPRRQVIQNSCTWVYRGGNCGYTGAYFDKNNKSCDEKHDTCPKTIEACKIRWLTDANYDGILPYGGFPGATRS